MLTNAVQHCANCCSSWAGRVCAVAHTMGEEYSDRRTKILTRKTVSRAHDNVKNHLSALTDWPISSASGPPELPGAGIPNPAPEWMISPDPSLFQERSRLLRSLTSLARGLAPL